MTEAGDIQDLFLPAVDTLLAGRRSVVSSQNLPTHTYPPLPSKLPSICSKSWRRKVFVATLLKDCNEEIVVGHGMERKRG